MTIWERVSNALTTLGLPMAANAMILASESERPDAYIVYFVVTDAAEQHADNNEQHRSTTVQVTYYNRNGLAGMPDIRGVMTAAGFMASSGRELPYNSQTRHFGYAMDFVYVE